MTPVVNANCQHTKAGQCPRELRLCWSSFVVPSPTVLIDCSTPRRREPLHAPPPIFVFVRCVDVNHSSLFLARSELAFSKSLPLICPSGSGRGHELLLLDGFGPSSVAPTRAPYRWHTTWTTPPRISPTQELSWE